MNPSDDPRVLRWAAIGTSFLFLGVMVVAPLAYVLVQAFADGVPVWWRRVTEPETLSAARMTVGLVAATIPVNTAFGLAAAWLLTRHAFPGRRLVLTVVDLPFSVSPVVTGLALVLLFGAHGWFGPWLRSHGLHVVFAWPAMLLATIFVTLPFVVRELVPLMEEMGTQAEEAATMLGASGWSTFRRVTLPAIRWALVYGMVLCATRGMGEFGAVSVVSGHIRGETNTLPLQAEILYNEYDNAGTFAVASLLVLLAGTTVAAKAWLERRLHR